MNQKKEENKRREGVEKMEKEKKRGEKTNVIK